MVKRIDGVSLEPPKRRDYMLLRSCMRMGCKFDPADVFSVFNGLSIIAPGGGCIL